LRGRPSQQHWPEVGIETFTFTGKVVTGGYRG
jgi:hypothetical protein